MKTITKLLLTAVLAAGLLSAPLAQATAYYGAVLFNPLTGHIVRLIGERHPNNKLMAEESVFYRNFAPSFNKYTKQYCGVILLEEISGLKKLYSFEDKHNIFGSKYGDFSIMQKLNLLALEHAKIKVNPLHQLFEKSNMPAKLADLRYSSDNTHKLISTVCKLQHSFNAPDPDSISFSPILKNELNKLKNEALPLKQIPITALTGHYTYSNKVKNQSLRITLQYYENSVKNWSNKYLDKFSVPDQKHKNITMYDIVSNEIDHVLKTEELHHLTSFLYNLYWKMLIFNLADYGFLGEIALAAEQKKDVFFYGGAAHTKEIINQLSHSGYQTIFLKELEWDTVLSEQDCKVILNWQPKSIKPFPIMDDELSITLAIKSKL